MSDTAALGTVDPTAGARTSRTRGAIRSLRGERRAVVVLLALQLAGLLYLSVAVYRAFSLQEDFGIYYQAWWLLGHGRLDPFSSLLGIPFVASNAELTFWPLAALGQLWGGAFLLLALQDLALVATNAVTIAWVGEALRREEHLSPHQQRVLRLATLTGILLDPWCYQSARYDFHFEVLIALVAVLTGRALWRGRSWLVILLGMLLLLSGSSGALAALGIGLGGLLTWKQRTLSGGLALAGVMDAILLSHFGLVGAHGALFNNQYRYLTSVQRGPVRWAAILEGILGRPVVPLRELASKAPLVMELAIPAGLLGVVSPWGFGMVVGVLLPGLLASGSFLNPFAAFQAWPALPFVTLGSAMLFAHLLQSRLPSRVRALLARFSLGVLGSATGVLLLVWASTTATIVDAQAQASSGAAAVLRNTTSADEVVAWASAVGRFSGRKWVYTFGVPSATLPIHSKSVVFLLPGPGVYGAGSTASASAGIARDAEGLGARRIPGAAPWIAFVWHPGPGVTAVHLAGFRPLRSVRA